MKIHWDDNKKKWILDHYADGIRKQFYSSQAGRKGLREVNEKYQAWLVGENIGDKTVEQISKQYLDDLQARRGIKCESYIQYEGYLRLHILPKLGKYRMNKVSLRMWQSVLNEAKGQKKPLSKKTLSNIRTLIMALVKYGYQNYQCDLLRGDLYIPVGHPAEEKSILTRNEVKRIFDQESTKWYYPLFCFLILTGMRPGEALGLQISDIKGDEIRIRRSVNKSGKITDGKNDNARRVIPLGTTAKRIIDQTIERNKKYKLNTDWIFCSADGGVGSQSTMRNHWNELKAERDINRAVTVYGLRHTFISLMKGVLPEQQIKDIVGHSTSMDTFGTYGHIVDGQSLKSAQIIDLTINQIAKES